jgi:alkylhydroperoxidase family enzyme
MNWASRRLYGREMAPLKLLAHNPRFLLPYAMMGTFAEGKTSLAPEIRLLAMYLTAEIAGCAWCLDFGRAKAQKLKLSPEKFGAIRDYAANPLFTPAERAALAFAEEMARIGDKVAEATFAELRRHFSEREIVELAVAIAAETFFNRLNVAFEIEAQGFCALR